MAEGTIGVRPSTTTGSEGVAIDKIEGINYPIYKEAFGAADSITLVSPTNGLPVDMATEAKIQQDDILTCLGRIEKQMEITNLHLAVMTNLHITKAELK